MTDREKAQAEARLEPELAPQVRALEEGRALVDLTWWRKVTVAGGDAPGWLNDLLAADLAGMDSGDARRSLLLSPTGRVRADVSVLRRARGYLLVQDPTQPDGIDALLAPYILSSDVALEDGTADLALLALPGRDEALDVTPLQGWEAFRPSCLGRGTDLIGPTASRREARLALQGALPDLIEVPESAMEAWRIARAVPRFPVDLTPDSLPHEADLGDAVAYHKGCYLGQEAVARVRNLGHPPFVLMPLSAEGPVSPGDPVLADGEDAGTVTSATPLENGRTAVIARLRWATRKSPLRTAAGEPLEPVTPPGSSASA